MNEGSVVLWISLILSLGAAGSLALFVSSSARAYRRLASVLVFAVFVATSVAFFLMTYYFLSSNMTIAYVHSHSQTDYPWYYKLAGAWSGAEGSMLLWTWLLSLSVLVFSMTGREDAPQRAWLRSLTSTLLLVVLAALIYILIAMDPFRPTPAMLLVTEGTSNGLGLSPVLQTPLVIVHPPLEFASYALITVPFAAAVAHLLTGKGRWASLAMQWTRAAWLFLTLAMVIGALWAYTVLGWGGYWAWDPVETSNLVIWIPLAALAHSQLWNRRKGQFPHVAPMLAAVVFALTFFATFETRTGVIISIHSFSGQGADSGRDLGSRLVGALKDGGAVPYFFTLMVVALLITGALFMLHFARLRRREGMVTSPVLSIPWIFAAAYLAAAVWAVLDISGITQFVLDVGKSLSFGVGALGFVILAGVFVGIPLLWTIFTSPIAETDENGLKTWISDDGTVNLALALFILWTIVTIALMLIGADALNPQDFEGRLPFLLIPVGIVLFTGLTWRFFKKEWAPYVALILGFTVLLSYALFSSNTGALYFPLVLALVFATGFKMYRSWAPAIMNRQLRIASMLILTSLLLSTVMWSTGLTQIDYIFGSIPWSLPLGVSGTVISVAGVFVLASAIGRSDIRFWIASAVLGIILLGFVAGSILSVIALALIVSSRGFFRPEERHRAIPVTSILRGSSPAIIHLGVALVVLGYAASTYFAAEQQVTATADRTASAFSGYQFRLLSSGGTDADGNGLYEAIDADVGVFRDGAYLFTVRLKMTWQSDIQNPHYLPDVVYRSGTVSDLYFTFSSFVSASGGFSIFDSPAFMTDNDALTEVTFLVRENPLMYPLWGGAWLMAIGIVIRLWSERGFYGRERPEETPLTRPQPEAAPVQPAEGEEDRYRRILEEELRKEEE